MNHILIVDDEVEIRESLEEILREEGYSVASAGTAAEALATARDPVYDVLLLDIWLPDRDGLEVLAELRSLGADARPEVIVISGHATIETAVKATKLGAFDLLEKPLMLERTLIVVKNAIEAKRLRTENLEFRRQLLLEPQITGESVQARAHRARHPRGEPAQRPRFRGVELRRHSRGLHRERALRLSQRSHQRRTAGEARNL
jgi:two-component system nitrogen regulation response regulator NtrX